MWWPYFRLAVHRGEIRTFFRRASYSLQDLGPKKFAEFDAILIKPAFMQVVEILLLLRCSGWREAKLRFFRKKIKFLFFFLKPSLLSHQTTFSCFLPLSFSPGPLFLPSLLSLGLCPTKDDPFLKLSLRASNWYQLLWDTSFSLFSPQIAPSNIFSSSHQDLTYLHRSWSCPQRTIFCVQDWSLLPRFLSSSSLLYCIFWFSDS